MNKLRHITFKWLNKYKNQLLNLSNIDEFKIRDIWIKQDDQYLDNFSNLQYNFEIPLYQKMIFRYRNGNKLSTRLYQGLDPCNKTRILYNYGLYYEDAHELMEFLAWIANGLGIYDILKLEDKDYSDK